MTTKTANGGQSKTIGSNRGAGRRPSSTCRRGCCWSPYGHSTVRDLYPPTDARVRQCHDDERGGDAA